MCFECGTNGPLRIAGTQTSTYLEAARNGEPWTLKLCPELEAALLIALSRRLRTPTMRFIHPSHHPPETLLEHLLEDLDLDFNYHPGLRGTILEGLHDRAKRLLCDAHSWRAIVKIDHPEDPNFYQWRVDIIMVDMRSVENAKRYIATMRVQAFNTVPRTRSNQQPKQPGLAGQVTLPVIQRPPPAPFQVAAARQQSAHTPMPRAVAFSALPLRGHSGSTTRPAATSWGRGNGYTVEQPIPQVPVQRFDQRVPFQGHGRRHTLAQDTTFNRRPPQGLGREGYAPLKLILCSPPTPISIFYKY
ncbi:hypothetical protein NM208_g42 [Fusarium decemcellulare]|uniref:Uncharacterized protein n=1 Tax=Fusarium decemcellulare TaxID=57161 RepID=A0ACC1T151_9HYPO|nr:hypothetical protein NM208_g42 [Fusarium decemcellulare]